MFDKLIQAVAESLSAAGFQVSVTGSEGRFVLRIAGAAFSVNAYGTRSLYINRWRVARPNTSTAVQRIVGYVLSELPFAIENAARQEKRAQEEKKRERVEPLVALSQYEFRRCGVERAALAALTLVLLKTEAFVAAAPFLKQLEQGDTFAALALADMLEEEYTEHQLVVNAVREAYQ